MSIVPPTNRPREGFMSPNHREMLLSPRLTTLGNQEAAGALLNPQSPSVYGASQGFGPTATGTAVLAVPPTDVARNGCTDRPRGDLRNFTLLVGERRWHRLPVRTFDRWLDDCPTDLGVDRCGRRRSRATDPNFRRGVKPGNAGRRYYATPYTDEQVLGFIAACPDTRAWRRMAALITLLWRSGLRISEALDLVAADLDREAGTITVRCGKGGKRGISAMDQFGFDAVDAWLLERVELPPGPIFCVATGPTAGEHWTPAGVRQGLARLKVRAGFDGRLAPHQLRHSHAVGLAKEGVLLPLISKQLRHNNIATTSTYLSGISPQDVIDAISARPVPQLHEEHSPPINGGPNGS